MNSGELFKIVFSDFFDLLPSGFSLTNQEESQGSFRLMIYEKTEKENFETFLDIKSLRLTRSNSLLGSF